MMKNKTTTMFQTGRIEFTVLDFLILNLFGPGLFRISCFGFRIHPRGVYFGPRGFFRASDFEFCSAGTRRRHDQNILGDLPAMKRRVLLSLAGAAAQENQAPLPLLQSTVFGRRES
jgi:hypothetical protein